MELMFTGPLHSKQEEKMRSYLLPLNGEKGCLLYMDPHITQKEDTTDVLPQVWHKRMQHAKRNTFLCSYVLAVPMY